MRLDASRYMRFWNNPEAYRLRECWKLAPVEPSAGSYAALLTFGRRRGTAFHELLDAAYRAVSEYEAIQSLKDGGLDDKVIEVAREMASVVRERYPGETYLSHEALFESPIEGTPHSLVGRIDHILEWDGEVIIGDWKTTKPRSKADLAYKADEYCRGVQPGFYLIGARQLGFHCTKFLYRMVQCGRQGSRPTITEHFTERTTRQLNELKRSVAMTCELILWLKKTYGIENPWPIVPEKFGNDYAPLIGTKCYEGYVPDGYQPKREHLPLSMEVA